VGSGRNAERRWAEIIAMPFTRLADERGDPRLTNMVMLGTLLEATGALSQSHVDAALRSLVKQVRWLVLDRCALQRGRSLFQEWHEEACHAV
jgi:2-oxoisovalerate ferredoxin oxidoreductase beta subunit